MSVASASVPARGSCPRAARSALIAVQGAWPGSWVSSRRRNLSTAVASGTPPRQARGRRSVASPGCRSGRPPAPRRPAHAIVAGNRRAASAPGRGAGDRARPRGRAARSPPATAPTGSLLPSAPGTARGASAAASSRQTRRGRKVARCCIALAQQPAGLSSRFPPAPTRLNQRLPRGSVSRN
jgi:hypothetical protein